MNFLKKEKKPKLKQLTAAPTFFLISQSEKICYFA